MRSPHLPSIKQFCEELLLKRPEFAQTDLPKWLRNQERGWDGNRIPVARFMIPVKLATPLEGAELKVCLWWGELNECDVKGEDTNTISIDIPIPYGPDLNLTHAAKVASYLPEAIKQANELLPIIIACAQSAGITLTAEI